MRTLFLKSIAVFVCFAFTVAFTFAETAQGAVLLQQVHVKYTSDMPDTLVKNEIEGKLTVSTEAITFASKSCSFTIDPTRVTVLSGGEFAKRRVKGAMVGFLFVGLPSFFALIGKKKREILLVEYCDQKGQVIAGEQPKLTGAPMFRYKPKGGRTIALESAIERVTGVEIVKDMPPEKPRKERKQAAADDVATHKQQ